MKRVLTLILMLSVVKATQAQTASDIKGVFEFKKNVAIELPTASRKYDKITETTNFPVPRPLQYTQQEVALNLPKLDTRVKVLTLPPDPLPKLYGNYVKAGFGNYASPYLEGFFNSKRNNKYAYGAHLKHFSSAKGPVPYSRFSDNRVDVHGSYFLKKATLNGRAFYDRYRYNYYGFQENPAFDNEDSIRQVLQTIGFNVGVESKDPASKLAYETQVGYTYLSALDKVSEGEFLWNGSALYALKPDGKIGVTAFLSSAKRTDSTALGRTLFQIKPYYLYTREALTVRAGINVAYSNDTLSTQDKLHLYPSVHAEYSLFEQKLIPFAGLDGEMQKTTLRSLIQENYFMAGQQPLLHTNKYFQVYIGARGRLLGALDYKLTVSSAGYRNLYFFTNSATDSSRFNLSYDSGNSQVLQFNGELGYRFQDKFKILLNTGYYHYNLNTLSQAWHRPGMVNRINLSYQLQKKLYFNLNFYHLNKLKGKNFATGEEFSLPDIADMSFKAEYLFSGQFSAFLECNNIFSQKYQRYLYYPNKGLNIIGGLTYSF